MEKLFKNKKDQPWLFRTYAGHSTSFETNKLFRSNLEKGQTGLSIAFDLPTQTGFDSDHSLAKGEVGKVGVPISHIGDMRTLFKNIPISEMNTSMTINATAGWLLSLYIAVAEEQQADVSKLKGTVQNDILKEYLSRGTYIFPPDSSLQIIADITEFCYRNAPKWNPINVCSYHLQEAGATPEQELSFALSIAISVLDKVRNQVSEDEFPYIVGRVSFFVNAGIRFITEMCKMRAFVELWDEICIKRYKISDSRMRRFRYGVQVNSLGLTEQQPENNVHRILFEMLAVTLSKRARARAVQLPAWNEAIGLPRKWDQQWSLRMQQILAYETDLLEFGDIFDGNKEIDLKVEELKEKAFKTIEKIDDMGGAVSAIGYMKSELVKSNLKRLTNIESGETVVVGVNQFINSEKNPLLTEKNNSLIVDPKVEIDQIKNLKKWRNDRDQKLVNDAINNLKDAVLKKKNIMEFSISAAKCGVTTGEWGDTMRSVLGEYTAPTGVSSTMSTNSSDGIKKVRNSVNILSNKLGRKIKILIGKPGLDGHSNGAEQIAVRARDVGMEVVYGGIRMTPHQIVNSAIEESVHIIGLSILSGSHLILVEEIMEKIKLEGLKNTPVIVGGIIPEKDEVPLKKMGVSNVYTPKNFDLNIIMEDIIKIIDNKSNSKIFSQP